MSTGIYIHIPFCRSKCAYCDFYSVVPTETIMNQYQIALCEEIKRVIPVQESVDSVYFGGGTPTMFTAERLCAVLNTLRAHASLTADCEISLEANPDSSPFSLLQQLHQNGFNRISFGMQSAVEEELAMLTRRHNVASAQTAVSLAKQAGFENISLDLMLGIPKQTVRSAQLSAEFCASLGVQHISAYMLKLEENTPLYRMKDSPLLANEETMCEIYETVCHTLGSHGYQQYEISNFAKSGFMCRHNLKYWELKPYIGIGPAAHSYYGKTRCYYPRDLNGFISGALDHRETRLFESEGGDIEEYVMLRLRLTEGLNLAELTRRYHCPANHLRTSLSPLIRDGLITQNEEFIVLTAKGFLVSNAVISYVLNQLQND